MRLFLAFAALAAAALAEDLIFRRNPYSFSVGLTPVDVFIGQVRAEGGFSSSPTYSIASGADFGDDIEAFTINPVTGRIRRKASTNEATTHQLIVEAASTDENGAPISVATTVDVVFKGVQCPIANVSVGTSGATCATSTFGKFWCWGQCQSGLCGYGSELDDQRVGNRLPDASTVPAMSFTPDADEGYVVQVVGLRGEYESNQAQCLRTSNGFIRCWGAGNYLPYAGGQDIATPNDAPRTYTYGPLTRRWLQTTDTSLHHGAKVIGLYAGESHFCAVLDQVITIRSGIGSNLECWGDTRMLGHPNDLNAVGNPAFSHAGEIIPSLTQYPVKEGG